MDIYEEAVDKKITHEKKKIEQHFKPNKYLRFQEKEYLDRPDH